MLTVKDIAKFKKEAGIRQSNKSTGDGNGLTICTAPKKKSSHQWFEGRFRYHGKSDSYYLGTFDKKLSSLETMVDKMAKANYNYATSQQELNKQQASLNKDLGEGIKMLGNSKSDIIQFLQKIGGNN